jgi:serine/threonine-protein kinase RsbW
VPERIRIELAIAAAEVINNIIDHAGRGRDLQIGMKLWVLDDHVRLEFADNGLPAEVDLAELRMPDVMAENGRGIPLARASLSELSYRRDQSGNHWTLVSRYFGRGVTPALS